MCFDAVVLKPGGDHLQRGRTAPGAHRRQQFLRQPDRRLVVRQQRAPAARCRTPPTTSPGCNSTPFSASAGIFDIASEFNIDRHREDFGQTLGRWGVARGPVHRAAVSRSLHPARYDRVAAGLRRADPVHYVDPSGCARRAGTCFARWTSGTTCCAPVQSWTRRRWTNTPSRATPTCKGGAPRSTRTTRPTTAERSPRRAGTDAHAGGRRPPNPALRRRSASSRCTGTRARALNGLHTVSRAVEGLRNPAIGRRSNDDRGSVRTKGKRMKRRFVVQLCAAVAVMAAFGGLAPLAQAADEAPDAMIKRLSDDVLATIKVGQVHQGRRHLQDHRAGRQQDHAQRELPAHDRGRRGPGLAPGHAGAAKALAGRIQDPAGAHLLGRACSRSPTRRSASSRSAARRKTPTCWCAPKSVAAATRSSWTTGSRRHRARAPAGRSTT